MNKFFRFLVNILALSVINNIICHYADVGTIALILIDLGLLYLVDLVLFLT